MPWDFAWEEAPRAPGRVTPEDVLYFYDEPLIYVSTMGFFDAICSKIDDNGTSNLVLICPTDNKTLAALKGGLISVRGALTAKNYWVADVDYDYVVRRAWTVPSNDLPEEYLPKKAYGLYPSFGRVPDTIEQAKAFFSIKFSGSELHADQMPFQTFKDLVNSAFSATKSLMTPYLLNGYKSPDVFNMPVAQPSFSSLAISVMKPEMDIAVINSRYARNQTVYSEQDIVRATTNRRNEFFEQAGELIEEINNGEISDHFAAEKVDWLKVILEVSPNPQRSIEDVEFTALTNQGRAYLHIDGNAGEKIRHAYEKALTAPVVMEGVIVEINGDSSTFLVRNTLTHRQVTCILLEETFKRLDRDGIITRGAHLRLRGNVESRVRRDKLRLTVDPEPIPVVIV